MSARTVEVVSQSWGETSLSATAQRYEDHSVLEPIGRLRRTLSRRTRSSRLRWLRHVPSFV